MDEYALGAKNLRTPANWFPLHSLTDFCYASRAMNDLIAIRIIRTYAVMLWLTALGFVLLAFSSWDLILYGEYGRQATIAGKFVISTIGLVIGLIIASGFLLWLRRRVGRTFGILTGGLVMLLSVVYIEFDHLLQLRSVAGMVQFGVFSVGVFLFTTNKRVKAALSR